MTRATLARWSLACLAVAIVAGVALAAASRGYCVRPRLRVELALLAAASLLLAPLALLRARALIRRGAAAASIAGSLALFALAGAVAYLVAWEGLTGALERGVQKRAMGDIRTLATAIQAYGVRHGRYPEVDGTAEDLARVLAADGDTTALPTHDGWGPAPFVVRSTARAYRITSYGCDCRPDDPASPVSRIGGTTSYASDVIFDTGAFIRFPEGTQR